ncbi:hypothetical protein QFC24_001455 [Naganishia onofrii]|uniref:Uncharacterized protein n=1 Tax=Naganishia onofrii TaxID=1851511 RepID=A0ACC2XWW6_9TREE|nr:hypothetical protein QFC24_001455 [Naganishia onofrii]
MDSSMNSMDVSSSNQTPPAFTNQTSGNIYSNPVVNNERPRLEEFPQMFASLGLPAREDWAYNMRHTAQQISERFYLGSNDVARSEALLEGMGITHV